MSDVNVDTMSEEDPEEEPRADGTEEDAAQPPAAQRQGQEEVRCDLPPGVSLPPRQEKFRSSNREGDWLPVNPGEAQAEYDSGQGDSDTGNPNGDVDDRTSSPNRLKTEMKEEVCPGGETSRKRLVPNNEAQPNQEPVDTDRNTSAVAEAIVTINVPQPNLDQADINGESAKTKRRREKKDQTGENSAEGRGTCDVNPERESRQKCTNQTDAIQTQKQPLGVELSNTRDTRMESSSGTRQKTLTVAESIQRSKAADRSGKLPNKAQGREDELVSVQISTPGSHGVEGSSENLEQEQRVLAAQGISTSKNTQRLTGAEHGSRIGATYDRTGRGLRDRVGRHQIPEGDRRNTRDGPGSAREDSGLRQEGTGDPQKGSTVAREDKIGDQIMRQQEREAVHPREDPNTGSELARQHRPVTTPESASEKSKERVRDGTSEQGQECGSKTVQLREGQTGGGLDQQQTAEKHTGAEDVGRSEARLSGPTPANPKEVDADPDGPCTTPVGYLLDSTDGVQNNRTKEQIIFEMSSHPCSKMLTVFGLGAQYLGYEHWQLEKMWNVQVPGCDNNVERVKHFLKALSAKGRTIHHVLLYFTQEESKRLDIVRLIKKIHICDCCRRILKTVEI